MKRIVMAAAIAATLAYTAGVGAETRGKVSEEGYARRLATLINEYRQQNGLPPLTTSAQLAVLASEHSAEMAAQHRLSHDGFRARFDRTSARICVENVGWNFPYPEAQLDGWRASPGHHRNLLEPKVGQMGLAVSGPYVTFFACS